MPAFQRKTVPFTHQGMDWVHPPDKIPEGKVCWAKNIRVLQKDTVTSAHGVTLWSVIEAGSAIYCHSLSRLNNSNPAQPPSPYVEIVGADNGICVGINSPNTINDITINPIKLPKGGTTGMSGNPLTLVDAAPFGGSSSWKYVGDANQNVSIGYYPGDSTNPGVGNNLGMARAITMGMTPPVVITPATAGAGGNLTGNYQWAFAFRRTFTIARSNLSAPTRVSVSSPMLTLSSQAATVTVPNTPIDPLTNTNDTNVVVDIYRFGGTVLRWALVGSAAGGTTFTDNFADAQLLTAPSPPQAVDPVTGLTRFNLFRPFVVPDIAHFGVNTTVSQTATSTWVLRLNSGGYVANVDWLPGSPISINNSVFTIFQVRDSGTVELTEDATGILTSGSAYSWSLPAGTLMAGTPMPHIWGVFGLGQSASFLFGCGAPLAPGTLYWTNGNDPDSTDLVNSLVVTSPSEPLRGGCIYDGRPYVFSTERMFAIYPSLTVAGQFTVEEVPGGRGLWMEYSLTVQSTGFSDQSITWRGKDGIYDWSIGGGLKCITTDLYPFFPHDNSPGIAPETIMPFLNQARSGTPEQVGNLDDSQPTRHRLTWFQGVLFYDFVAQSLAGQTFSTLVYDQVNCGGWVSLDQPFVTTTLPVARGVDVAQNNMKVSWGANVYDYTGTTRVFRSRIVTRADDAGDPRANKLYGDYWLDCTQLANDFSVIPLINFHRSSLPQNTLPFSGSRNEVVLDFQGGVNGLGLLTQTLGLDIQWTAGNSQFSTVLNQWQPAFVSKGDSALQRATDKTDDGRTGDKYLRGVWLEAINLTGAPINFDLLVDNTSVGPFTWNPVGSSAVSQLEEAFALSSPKVGAEFQVQIVAGQNASWQLLNVRWIWEPYPDNTALFSPFTDCGYRGVKFMQGGVIPIDTGGNTINFTLVYDGGTFVVGPFNTPAGFKTPVPFSFPPFLAHELQWQPTGPVRAWYEEVRWIWEPSPELVTRWKTPPMTHGLSGWLHQRTLWIAYLASAQVIFTRYFSDGTQESITLPSTGGVYSKTLFIPAPKKFLAAQYEAISTQPLKVFVNDCEFATRSWGSEGPYQVVKPIGAPSVVQGAEI
jgi:hypothetical protein